ncbi:MAG: SRPBCC family protein [Candidatus Hodarchaeales archaeon]|jgi:uncharacterized protein YndB with AHSA1/START domain
MLILSDSIEIKASPEDIFNWFMNLEKNYQQWHPDHVKCELIGGNEVKEGTSFYFEEYLHGSLHKLKMRITKLEKPNKIVYKNSFPISLINPKGSFIIEKSGDTSIFTATSSFRFEKTLLKLVKKRGEAFQKHMKEEGENLKLIFES